LVTTPKLPTKQHTEEKAVNFPQPTAAQTLNKIYNGPL
jgi:hypothetical protein